jgi:hypothetical protein
MGLRCQRVCFAPSHCLHWWLFFFIDVPQEGLALQWFNSLGVAQLRRSGNPLACEAHMCFPLSTSGDEDVHAFCIELEIETPKVCQGTLTDQIA